MQLQVLSPFAPKHLVRNLEEIFPTMQEVCPEEEQQEEVPKVKEDSKPEPTIQEQLKAMASATTIKKGPEVIDASIEQVKA